MELGERDQDPVRDGAVDTEPLRHVLYREPLRLPGDQFEGEQTASGLGRCGPSVPPPPP